jgi:hypothetical protein
VFLTIDPQPKESVPMFALVLSLAVAGQTPQAATKMTPQASYQSSSQTTTLLGAPAPQAVYAVPQATYGVTQATYGAYESYGASGACSQSMGVQETVVKVKTRVRRGFGGLFHRRRAGAYGSGC